MIKKGWRWKMMMRRGRRTKRMRRRSALKGWGNR
jgi:hypothetical protein